MKRQLIMGVERRFRDGLGGPKKKEKRWEIGKSKEVKRPKGLKGGNERAN